MNNQYNRIGMLLGCFQQLFSLLLCIRLLFVQYQYQGTVADFHTTKAVRVPPNGQKVVGG